VAGLSDAPAGWASAPVLDAGYEHVCSLGSDGAVRCWGQDDDVHTPINDVPSTGPFAQLEVGAAVACGLDAAGQATCWGWSEWGADSAPHEAFSRLSSGAAYTCGVVAGSGAVSCWGQDLAGETEPPSQYTFSDVAAGGTTTCGVTADHATVRCWGQDHDIRLPNLEYVRVGMGYDFVCALDVDGQIHCSGGDNEYGQLDAPT
jgi:alpha-tubulin suppressor-like RCC1 family protein